MTEQERRHRIKQIALELRNTQLTKEQASALQDEYKRLRDKK